VIPLTAERDIGPLLRRLRLDAGLAVRDLADRAHVSKSGISKREHRPGMTTAGLIHHLDALGYELAVVAARPTGTGWPE
jgi:transcriptional regulator with XRE-family HTH domain